MGIDEFGEITENNIVANIISSAGIIIRQQSIHSCVDNIEKSGNNLLSKQLSISFSYSSGKMVDELNEYAQKLKETGDAVAELMIKTSKLLKSAADKFTDVDNDIANNILRGK